MSWFSFETEDFVIHGLWKHPMKDYMDTLASQGCNALRVPFSSEWILYNRYTYPYEGMVAADPEHQHLSSLENLDDLFDMAHARNISVMLDLHRLHKEYISELWYSSTDSAFPASSFFDTWDFMLARYGNHPALIAIDILNEPHGRATWGSGDPSTDWRLFAESAITELSKRHPNGTWLYLVEGIGWGQVLSGARQNPLRVPDTGRLVYSTHNYGKSVVPAIDSSNVENLWRQWNDKFGFLVNEGGMEMEGT
jgi:endoglucanase